MFATAPLFLRRRAAAFTLLEMLLVIGLVAVLTSLVIGSGRRASDAGKAAQARAELAALAVALDAYRLASGDYPRTEDPALLLQALIGRRGPDLQAWSRRGCLDIARFRTLAGADPLADDTAVLADPWGNPYRYAYKSQSPWSNPAYVLYSAGADGVASETLLTGGFPDRTAAGNADNLHAGQP